MSISNQREIIVLLSAEIMENLTRQAQEERHPGFDPDRMEEIVKDCKHRAAELRGMRTRLEDIFAGTCT